MVRQVSERSRGRKLRHFDWKLFVLSCPRSCESLPDLKLHDLIEQFINLRLIKTGQELARDVQRRKVSQAMMMLSTCEPEDAALQEMPRTEMISEKMSETSQGDPGVWGSPGRPLDKRAASDQYSHHCGQVLSVTRPV